MGASVGSGPWSVSSSGGEGLPATFDLAGDVVKGPTERPLTGRRAERNVLPDTASGRSAAERTFGGLSDEQMRVRPREDLNSLAWLLWHIARVEDSMVNRVLAGR